MQLLVKRLGALPTLISEAPRMEMATCWLLGLHDSDSQNFYPSVSDPVHDLEGADANRTHGCRQNKVDRRVSIGDLIALRTPEAWIPSQAPSNCVQVLPEVGGVCAQRFDLPGRPS